MNSRYPEGCVLSEAHDLVPAGVSLPLEAGFMALAWAMELFEQDGRCRTDNKGVSSLFSTRSSFEDASERCLAEMWYTYVPTGCGQQPRT